MEAFLNGKCDENYSSVCCNNGDDTMNVTNVAAVTIQEGNVNRISQGGVTLWEKNMKNMQLYEIRRKGNKIDNTTISKLKEDIFLWQDNLSNFKYKIGDQLIIPWTDPATGTVYECPFNFGTLQNWTLEDGTVKYGLGLESEYLLPSVDIMFDNAEPSNNDNSRKTHGSSRWKDSSIRQWLNASGENWYIAQHSSDTEPATYNTWPGFLSTLSPDFVNALTPVQVSTQTHSVDGGGVDVTVDKFFLLSTYEMNLAHSANQYTAADDLEGTPWDIWKQKNNGALWTSATDRAQSATRVKKNIENNAANSSWLRSAFFVTSSHVWRVTESGTFNSAYTDQALRRVAPACVICG